MTVEGGRPSPEEIAAILVALEATLAAAAPQDARAQAPAWRLAARLPVRDIDALRHARDAWRLSRSRMA
ncbi:MAG: hypothetical protein KGM44_02995 [bacterium]|nr:hypothetical protein [bacterium]